MSTKASKLEKEKRIFTVQGWILEGVQDDLILKQIKTEWGLSLRMARRYLKIAFENWKRDETISIEARRESRIADLKQDIRKLKPEFQGTPAGMRATLALKKELNKLEDLYPPKRIQLSGDPENPLVVNNNQPIQLIIKSNKELKSNGE